MLTLLPHLQNRLHIGTQAQYISRSLTIIFAIFSFFFVAPSHSSPLQVTIILSEEGGAYHQFAQALAVNLPSGVNVRTQLADVAVLENDDLLIAVGVKSAAIAAKSKNSAVLNVLIPKFAYEKLQSEFSRPGNHHPYSAIYLEQPPGRQLEFIAKLLPQADSVGILYSRLPPELGDLKRISAGWGQHIHEQAVTSDMPLPTALGKILNDCVVLLAMPDAEVFNSNTIRNILLSSYRSRVPLVSFSASYVKAGALGAVFSTPEQVAAQAGLFIERFKQKGALPAAQYPDDFEVMVNAQVARSLGLNIKNASELKMEMRK